MRDIELPLVQYMHLDRNIAECRDGGEMGVQDRQTGKRGDTRTQALILTPYSQATSVTSQTDWHRTGIRYYCIVGVDFRRFIAQQSEKSPNQQPAFQASRLGRPPFVHTKRKQLQHCTWRCQTRVKLRTHFQESCGGTLQRPARQRVKSISTTAVIE